MNRTLIYFLLRIHFHPLLLLNNINQNCVHHMIIVAVSIVHCFNSKIDLSL